MESTRDRNPIGLAKYKQLSNPMIGNSMLNGNFYLLISKYNW